MLKIYATMLSSNIPFLLLLFREVAYFQNDTLGTNAISWAPFSSLHSINEDGRPVRRVVTGSCDNYVRIWKAAEGSGVWTEESKALMSSPHSGILNEDVDIVEGLICVCIYYRNQQGYDYFYF